MSVQAKEASYTESLGHGSESHVCLSEPHPLLTQGNAQGHNRWL